MRQPKTRSGVYKQHRMNSAIQRGGNTFQHEYDGKRLHYQGASNPTWYSMAPTPGGRRFKPISWAISAIIAPLPAMRVASTADTHQKSPFAAKALTTINQGKRCLRLALALALPTLLLPQVSWGQSLDGLGGLSGNDSDAAGVSADGLVVVGISDNRAFRWTSVAGMTSLGPGAGRAYAVNSDGSVVVGYEGSFGTREAVRWTNDGGTQILGTLPGGATSNAYGVNADGSVVVGESDSIDGLRAFRWTDFGGMQHLSALDGGTSSARGVSGDGQIVVGRSTSGDGTRAFRWTEADGMESLGVLDGGAASEASAISANGLVIVGFSESSDGTRAFRWTESGGMRDLGLFAGRGESMAHAVNADGQVIVGAATAPDGTDSQAFRWKESTGMQSLEDLLTAQGVDISGWELADATGVSGDGEIIVGAGWTGADSQGFIVYLPIDEDGPPPGLTTPERLSRALADTGAAGQQAQGAVMGGLGQTLTVARLFSGSQSLPDRLTGNVQMASLAPNVSYGAPRASRWSFYALGNLGNGYFGESGSWGLDGAVGLAADVSPGWRVGGGVIGSYSRFDLDFGGESRLDALGGSTFAAYEGANGLRLGAAAYLAQLDVRTDRRYQNGAGIDSSQGDTDGLGYGLALNAGWAFPVASATSLTPFAEVQWSRSELKGYEEHGGAFAASVSDQDGRSTVSRLGAEIAHSVSPTLEVQASAAWARRLDGDAGTVNATTLGLTQVMTPGLGDSDWAEGSFATVWQANDRAQLYAQLTSRSGETQALALGATAGITWNF